MSTRDRSRKRPHHEIRNGRPYGPGVWRRHVRLLRKSAIKPKTAANRGYRSVERKSTLRKLGFGRAQLNVPGLLIPIRNVLGKIGTYQFRPDKPRINRNGKAIKYETPGGSRMVLDVPPRARKWLGNPKRPLFITEGARKADAAVSRKLCCIALLGVFGFRGRNEKGGITALSDWEYVTLKGRLVYLVFDSDVVQKSMVAKALARLKAFLESRGAEVRIVYLPPGEAGGKVGLDDFFAAGSTVDDLLGYASETLRHPPDELPRYVIQDGRICRTRRSAGEVVTEPLGNFTARIVEEQVLDNGVEPTRAFLIKGRLETGEKLPPARIPVGHFTSLGWVTENWGNSAIVTAGMSNDFLREAIQRLSPAVRRELVFTHTGWRKLDHGWTYLTHRTPTPKKGPQVDLGPDLQRYTLPRAPKKRVQSMKRSLALLRVAPLSVTLPLFAAVYRAPLASFLPVDHSIWLEGPTGSLKSTLAALFLSHYGAFERTNLPGAWSSTANQLEHRAFTLKDTIFVIDDWAPSALDARELETKAARIIRSQGNRSGRSRLRADLSERPTYPPRGVIISTAEQRPPGQSLIARTVILDVARDAIHRNRLTRAQAATRQLRHALAGYLEWLAPQLDALKVKLSKDFLEARRRATKDSGHLRLPEAVAHLWIGVKLALRYAEEIGASSSQDTKRLRKKYWKVLLTIGRAQGHSVEEEQPTRRFLRMLSTLLTQRRVILLSKEHGGAVPDREHGTFIGWLSKQFVFLIPDAAYTAVSRSCAESGEPLAVRQTRLLKDFARQDLSIHDKGRNTTTVNIGGKTHRVVQLHRKAIEELIGEELPAYQSDPSTYGAASSE